MFALRKSLVVWVILMFSSCLLAAGPQWQAPYAGDQATGGHVTVMLHFDGPDQARDSSSHNLKAALQATGSSFVKDGKFGGALQVTPDKVVQDKAHGILIPDNALLNPKGAFSIEMWFSPDERLADLKDSFLLDKRGFYYKTDKPNANQGYLLMIRRVGAGQYSIEAQLGYGTSSDFLPSNPVALKAGQWYHVGFSYDGRGQSRITLDGMEIGHFDMPGRGAIAAGNYSLAIGDRATSIHVPFAGRIDEVRLTNQAVHFGLNAILLNLRDSRTAFYRMEKGANLRLEVVNDTAVAVSDAAVVLSGSGVRDQTVKIPPLQPQERKLVEFPVDTQLEMGHYTLTASVSTGNKGVESRPTAVELTIVPRPIPHTMPVVMWGTPDALEELTDIGFTHYLDGWYYPLFEDVWKAGKSQDMRDEARFRQLRQKIDEAFGLGLKVAAGLSPGRWVGQTQKEYDRINRDGKLYDGENICGQFPLLHDYMLHVGQTVAQTLGDLPGLGAAMIHTEIRDHNNLCFHDVDKEAYRKFSGGAIPDSAIGKRGVSYRSVKGFPASRIISDADPLLKYLKWFWQPGDGWNEMNSLVSQGLHSTGRNDVWTWEDPAIRVPSVWGSGGNVDVISQWTYTYPDPIKVGLAADDLLAMAKGHPGQKVMNMIQIIWYRSQTAPKPKEGEKAPPSDNGWETTVPDAQFISISPDHLSEGTWLELARPIQGIMNHGWGSMGTEVGYHQGSYTTTDVGTRARLKQLIHEVVQPLGPTLMQVPDRKADVAYLQSFTSQMYAGRGTYGWGGGWGADAYTVLRYAALQPEIVYEETIQKFGLDQYKVLVLADCDVLPVSVATAIRKFQALGGLVVGDENLAPGIQPDIVLKSYKRTQKPDQDKAALVGMAKKLAQDLSGFYTPAAASTNLDVLVRLRQYEDSDYFFAVNDHRTFGDYLGQYGLVMEKGLPSETTLTLNRKAGHVYDLSVHQAVAEVRSTDGRLSFNSHFGPGQGRLFLVTDRAISQVRVDVPHGGRAGEAITGSVTIADDAGAAIAAVIPVKITISDPNGGMAEYSGYYGARDGKVELKLDLPTNAVAGTWKMEATELASGRTGHAEFKVE